MSTLRRHNEFRGSYVGGHAEIDAKETSLGFKLLFIAIFIIAFGGAGAGIFVGLFNNGEGLVTVILVTLGLIILLVGVLCGWGFAIAGKLTTSIKIIAGVLSVVGLVIALIPILIQFMNPFFLLACGLPSIFMITGLAMLIGGIQSKKKKRNNCTQSVMARCIGFEEMNPRMMMFENKNIPRSYQNQTSRVLVSRSVWEYEYNGMLYRSTPEQYTGGLKIKAGESTKIFINPLNPNELYCEKNNLASALISTGVVFIVITLVVMVPITAFIIQLINYL